MTREELKRSIEIADLVLWETPHMGQYVKDRCWLERERARLVRELEALQQQEERT
jgi:hypothetical protein